MTGITCALAGGSGATGTLTSVTFTSNGTWVAPVGVSNVVSASGKGAAGVSDYPGTFSGQYYGLQSSGTQPNAPFAQWGTIYNSYQAGLAQLAGRSYPGYGPSVFSYFDTIYVDTSDRWIRYNFGTSDLSSAYVTGYSTSSVGSPSTSGNMTYANTGVISGWAININIIEAGGTGAAATALGQTFPGGSYTGSYPNGVGNAAVTTTYTNIAVTPGTSYSIVVPSGGEVTLQYYV